MFAQTVCRKFVELRRNLVEITSKTDLIRQQKEKMNSQSSHKCVLLTFETFHSKIDAESF